MRHLSRRWRRYLRLSRRTNEAEGGGGRDRSATAPRSRSAGTRAADAVEDFGRQRPAREVILDRVEHRDDINAGIREPLSLRVGEGRPDGTQLGVELSSPGGERDQAAPRVVSIARIGHQSFLSHGLRDADDCGMRQTQAVGEVGDGQRAVVAQELVGRRPPSAKRETACGVQLVGGAEQCVGQSTEAVVEDERSELSNVVHGTH